MIRRRNDEAPPESDAYDGAPHPRETMELFGHGEAERTLLDSYRSGRMPQAWVIGGLEGIGKATLAWRLTRFIFAHPDPASPEVQGATTLAIPPESLAARRVASLAHGDLALLRREWNEKSKRHFTEIRVDDVRRAIDLFHHAAGEGGWRVCIVDCAEDMNRSSANALLKLIEEPPPKSLFLIVSHRPGALLPTIRSRSRLLLLQPLDVADVARATTALGEPWSEFGAEIAAASARSGGSVRRALRLLDNDRLGFAKRLDGLFAALPDVDWREVHGIADKVAGTAAADEFEAAITAILDWLDERVRAEAGGGAARLAAYAHVWEKATDAVREAEALNLDKRPIILSIFADLATATRAAHR